MPGETKSLAKGLALLETLGTSPHPLTAGQLGLALKLPRPTVYRLLRTLVQQEFVAREADAPAYRLTFKLLDLGQQLIERTDLAEVARPVLRKLSTEFRETVHLAIPDEDRMVYLDKVIGSGPFCANSRIGRSVPMHCTALGKAVLAFLPPPRVRAILDRRGMLGYTAKTIVTAAAMESDLARIRQRGYAVDDIEFEEGVRCVGVPIFDHRGLPTAAMSVSAPVSRMSKARVREVGAALAVGAAQASRAMGWRPDSAPARAAGTVGGDRLRRPGKPLERVSSPPRAAGPTGRRISDG